MMNTLLDRATIVVAILATVLFAFALVHHAAVSVAEIVRRIRRRRSQAAFDHDVSQFAARVCAVPILQASWVDRRWKSGELAQIAFNASGTWPLDPAYMARGCLGRWHTRLILELVDAPGAGARLYGPGPYAHAVVLSPSGARCCVPVQWLRIPSPAEVKEQCARKS